MKKRKISKIINSVATLLTILGMLGPFSFQGFKIAHATTGTIYGTVETSSHAAVTSGTVCAYPSANFTAYENQCDSLDGAGAFLFTVSNVGATYTYNVYVTDANDVAPAAATFVFDGSNKDLGAIHLIAPSVRGIVKNPDGSLASSANVMIHDATFSSNNSTVMTDTNGVFKGGALAAGTYYIDVTAPAMSSGVLSTRNLAVTVTGSTNTYYVSNPIQLVAAKKTITGTVTKPDGTKVTDATINAFSIDGLSGMASADTDANGQYSVLIGQGKFQVMVNPKMGYSQPTWGYFDAPKTVSFAQDNIIAESQTVNFQVTKFDSTITGRLVYPNGTPVISGAASISAMIAGGYGSCINSGPDGDGNFSLSVASNNTYQINLWIMNNQYGSPDIAQQTIGAAETKNLGTITLEIKTAIISGQVTDSNDAPLANKSVSAWKSTGSGWASTSTDSSGNYSFYVNSGSWFVDVMGGTDMTGGVTKQYVKTQAPKKLIVADNETKSNNNFILTLADATINGVVVDTDGNVLSSINSFAYANDVNRQIGTGGEMMGFSDLGGMVSNGVFTVRVPAGTYQIGVMMPPGSAYTPSASSTITVISGQNYTGASITLLPNNAAIAGSLKDSNGNVLSSVAGGIFADNGHGAHQMTPIENGTYSLSVAAGNWRVGYMVSPSSGYLSGKLSSSSITVAANSTAINDITLLKADSTINVTVVDPNGQPLKNAWVSANNELAGRQSSTEQMGMMGGMFNQGNVTDANGQASIKVPAGTYFISATLPADQGYIFPAAQQVTASASTPATVEMQFRQANGTISGTVSLNSTASAAYVSAWSEDGAFSEVTTSNGSYTLNVMKNQTWHISAAYETSTSFYQSNEHSVVVPASGTASQDLALVLSDITVSPPETSNFDSTKTKIMTLVDGTTIDMSAYSIATTGNVTLTATPKAQGVPRTASAKPIALAYDLEVMDSTGKPIATFQSDVTITLKYTAKQLSDLGITADQISPMYYDATTGTWKAVSNVVVDTTNKTVAFTTSHFTNFAITTSKVGTASVLAITVSSPADHSTVNTNSVMVSGTVSDAAATVTASLNSGTSQAVTVNSDGSFSKTISVLSLGSNTITVNAIKGLDSTSASRTVVYAIASSDEESNNNVATGVELELVTIPKDGSSQVRVFSRQGNVLASFFAYDKNLKGEFNVITADVNGDGYKEIITYPSEGFGSQIRVFDHRGKFIDDFFSYQKTFRGGIVVTAADVNGDGNADLVVQPKSKGGSNIRIYKFNTSTRVFELLDWFMAYQDNFRGKLNLVASDIDGNNTAEIILAPAEVGGPNVRVYKYNSTTKKMELLDWFMAYQESYKRGVNIAAADVNGDGLKEIVTAPASYGGPNVRVYQYNATTKQFSLLDWFMAYQETYRGGVNIKLADVNNDSQAEIITTPAGRGGPNVRVFQYSTATGQFSLLDWFMAYKEDFRGGVNVAVSDVDKDSNYEIVTSPNAMGGPNLRLYEYNPANSQFELMTWKMIYDDKFRGKISVKVADLDGNGDSEIIVSPLSKGGPNVRIYDFSDSTLSLSKWFMAYDETFRGGVKVTTGR